MKRRRRQRQSSPLYLPLWSLALMFVTVLVMAFGIVFVIANIGANDPEESGPIFVIITAEPTIARSAPPALSLVPASPTIPGEFDRQPDTDFSLTGPTLVPVVFTSTPESIAVGKFVIIYDVGLQQLNIRDSAGVTDSSIVFRGEEGERFAVIDGPVQADGLTWWMLQDPQNNTRTGWAASNYLIAQPQE